MSGTVVFLSVRRRRLSSRRGGVELGRPLVQAARRRLSAASNPPGGYVQNANNLPRFVSARDPIDMTGYPSYFERGPLALAAARARHARVEADLHRRRPDRVEAYDAYAPRRTSEADLIEAVRTANAGGNGSADVRSHLTDGLAALEEWDNTVSVGKRRGALPAVLGPLFARRRPGVRDAVGRVSVRRHASRHRRPQRRGDSWPPPFARFVSSSAQSESPGATFTGFAPDRLDLPGDGIAGTHGAYRVMTSIRCQGRPRA